MTLIDDDYSDWLESEAGVALQRVAKRLGMPWHCGEWGRYRRGMGVGVTVASELAHELGHWLVAPPSRRHVAYFGLGSPNELLRGQRVDPDFADDEERRASLMGVVLLRRVGGDAETALHDHGWVVDPSRPDLTNRFGERPVPALWLTDLCNAGLISRREANGVQLQLKRIWRQV